MGMGRLTPDATQASVESLLDKVELSKHVAVAVASAVPTSPTTALMHVRFPDSEVAETLPHAAPNRAA